MANVLRSYCCPSCGHKWSVIARKDSFKGAPCTKCTAQADRYHPVIPKSNFTASQAVDATYKMVERDYGYTNMKDNMREGDVAFAPSNPVAQTLEKQGGFFGGGRPTQVAAAQGSMMQMAANARAQRQAEGTKNAFANFQQAVKSDMSPIDRTRMNPIARHKV